MDYKKEYELLKEKIIDKYDYHLSSYILEDIIDVGEVDYLIGNDDELLYNQNLSIDLKDIISSFINEESKTYTKELAIKLIELKKITDKRIVNNPDYEYREAYEFIFNEKFEDSSKPVKEIIHIPHIELNINLTDKERVLDDVFSFLKSKNYIETSKKHFLSHFDRSQKIEEKINWTGPNLISLVGFITDLFDKNIIQRHKKRKHKNKIIMEHFILNNKNLNFNSVKTTGSKTYNTKEYKEINDFINKLKIDFS